MVIHFSGPNKEGAEIIETDLNEFCTSQEPGQGPRYEPLYLVHYKDDNDSWRNWSIENARALLENKMLSGKYHAIYLNCDTFATLCRTGQLLICDQVQSILETVARGTFMVLRAGSQSLGIS